MLNWVLCNTRTELPTIKTIGTKSSFYMHSSYDPLKEATRWVNSE